MSQRSRKRQPVNQPISHWTDEWVRPSEEEKEWHLKRARELL